MTNHQSNGATPPNMVFVGREKSSLIVDPWAKRNPTLVAQNVLLKHRAELEKLSNSRNTNNSQSSNVSNLITTGGLAGGGLGGGAGGGTASTGAILSNLNGTSKYLMPDSKYAKK